MANIFKANLSLKVKGLETIFVPKRLKLENKFCSIAFEVHFLKIFHKKVEDRKNPLFPQKSYNLTKFYQIEGPVLYGHQF